MPTADMAGKFKLGTQNNSLQHTRLLITKKRCWEPSQHGLMCAVTHLRLMVSPQMAIKQQYRPGILINRVLHL